MKSSDSGKNIGCRDQYHKLAHDRYDHTEYCLSKCLEHSTRNNTEPCDQIVDSDDPQGRNSDGEHLVRCIKHTQKYLWDSFKAEESDEGEAEGNQHTELDRLEHTFSLTGTIIVGNDRSNPIVETEYRHEEETL